LTIVPKRKLKKIILPITKQKDKKGKKSPIPADPSFSIDNPKPTD